MEEVVGKMQTGHKTMVQNMIDDFKQCSPPAKVLQPLQAVLEEAAFTNVQVLDGGLRAWEAEAEDEDAGVPPLVIDEDVQGGLVGAWV